MKHLLFFLSSVLILVILPSCNGRDDDLCTGGTGNSWDSQDDRFDPYFPYDGTQKVLSYRFQDSNNLIYDIEFKLKSYSVMDTVAGSPYSSCDTTFREITRYVYTPKEKLHTEISLERNVTDNFYWREPYYEYFMSPRVYVNPDLINDETNFYDSIDINDFVYYDCFRRLNRTRFSTYKDYSTYAEIIYNEEYGFIKIEDPTRQLSYLLNM